MTLDGHQGITGVFRSLFWPTESGLRDGTRFLAYEDRFPEREVERWDFVVSSEGLKRMREYLESLRGELLSDHRGWYRGKRSYHLLHLCHHVVLRALREGGLPVAPWWAYTGWQTKIQLRRALSFHEELESYTPPPSPRSDKEASDD
ncbi:MAG: hypothetical protein AAF517_00125 [Planctomycetota bacterium]